MTGEFVGYIVQSRRGFGPLHYTSTRVSAPPRALFTSSNRITVFRSKADAYRAIQATLKFSAREGYDWQRSEYFLTRLEDAGR